MDFPDWIAASKRMEFVTPLNDTQLKAYFARFKPRGFLADFIDRPIVAEGNGTKLTIARKSSFFGRSRSVQCVVEVKRNERGNLLRVRLWHGPFLTAWFCLSYALALVVLLAASIAMIQGSQVANSAAVGIAGIAMAGFWVLITGVFNAFFRAQKQKAIDELVGVFSELKKVAPSGSE